MDDALDDADGAVVWDESAPVGANAPLSFTFGAGTAAPGQFAVAGGTPGSPGFALAAHVASAINSAFNEFVQWQSGGTNLGAPDVRTLNFVDPTGVLTVTRGVGDHSNVITVKLNRQYAYFTSILYPFLVQDTLSMALPVAQPSGLFGVTLDTLSLALPLMQSGTLVATLNPLSYTNWRDINPETLSMAIPVAQSGTLVVTINYLDYVNWRDVNPETLSMPVPVAQSGTLVVTISYLDYLNWRDINPETMSMAIPVMQSGTLV